MNKLPLLNYIDGLFLHMRSKDILTPDSWQGKVWYKYIYTILTKKLNIFEITKEPALEKTQHK